MSRTMPAAGGKATIALLQASLIRLTWSPGTEVQEADARDVLERSLMIVDHVPYGILVDMRQILMMSPGAREAFAAEADVLAAALLGHTAMDRVLAASAEQAVHRVRFFTDEDAALTWLASHLPDPERTN